MVWLPAVMETIARTKPLPQFLLQALQEHWGEPLAIACSGGVDSLVLTHALAHAATLQPNAFPSLAVFHVDHGQHHRSEEISKWLEDWCRKYKLLFFKTRLTTIEQGASEATLRQHRYAAFETLWNQWQGPSARVSLILAHHAQDQLETMLFRLLRGTHPLTLRGMSKKSHRGRLQLLRPLLGHTKQDLFDYAARNQLTWQDDPTNDNTAYARNALRHKLLPLLEDLRPHSHEKLLQFLSDLQQIQRELAVKTETHQQKQVSPHLINDEIDIRTVSINEILSWTQDLLAAQNQKVKRIHWENLKKALKTGLSNGERRTLEFPGGLKITIHRRKLRFFPGKT